MRCKLVKTFCRKTLLNENGHEVPRGSFSLAASQENPCWMATRISRTWTRSYEELSLKNLAEPGLHNYAVERLFA